MFECITSDYKKLILILSLRYFWIRFTTKLLFLENSEIITFHLKLNEKLNLNFPNNKNEDQRNFKTQVQVFKNQTIFDASTYEEGINVKFNSTFSI